LSDTERTVAQSLGVKRMFRVGPNRRTTFVIDTDRKVLAVFDSQTNMNSHADDALEVLRARTANA
jgi:peroxiredoxin Q/BCP